MLLMDDEAVVMDFIAPVDGSEATEGNLNISAKWQRPNLESRHRVDDPLGIFNIL